MSTFDQHRQAEEAVADLRQQGFDREVSLLVKDSERTKGREGGIGEGVTTGGVLGGLAGLALGAGALAIPGIGPVVALGPITGLLSGAATGGVAGGLVDWGIPETEGRNYEAEVQQGKTLVAVRTEETKINNAADVLRNHGSKNVQIH